MQMQRTEQWLPKGKGLREGEMGKGDQLYGDGWRINFWWGACCSVYRSRNIMSYT